MGIILELLGIAATLMFGYAALKRAGVDIGWLNPFTFFHRLAWKKQLQVPALHSLEHPVDVAAAFGLAMIQHAGMPTAEQKQGLLSLYARHLKSDARESESLWIASSHLLRRSPIDPEEVPSMFGRSASKFSPYHVEALIALMSEAALLDDTRSPQQQALIDAVRSFFAKHRPDPGSWKTT
jgi:hypothetical protein